MNIYSDYYESLTPDQRRALHSLERALKKVHAAGLSLVGMDNEIFAAKDEDIDHEKMSNGGFLINQDRSLTLDAPCYVDSGGW